MYFFIAIISVVQELNFMYRIVVSEGLGGGGGGSGCIEFCTFSCSPKHKSLQPFGRLSLYIKIYNTTSSISIRQTTMWRLLQPTLETEGSNIAAAGVFPPLCTDTATLNN